MEEVDTADMRQTLMITGYFYTSLLIRMSVPKVPISNYDPGLAERVTTV